MTPFEDEFNSPLTQRKNMITQKRVHEVQVIRVKDKASKMHSTTGDVVFRLWLPDGNGLSTQVQPISKNKRMGWTLTD